MELQLINQYGNALLKYVDRWVNAVGKDPEKRRKGVDCLLADLNFALQHCEIGDSVSAKNALRAAFEGALELRIIPRVGRVILR